jgi:UDP-N-acetylmuramoyl-tripeptide--D-alanyl-D-alanine ligase
MLDTRNSILITLWLAGAAADAAAFCALWQLKEYRWDRMRDFFARHGYWVFGLSFLRHPVRLPAPTPRAVSLILAAILVELAVISFFFHWITFVAFLFLRFYLFSALILLLGVPTRIVKRHIIGRASKKMRRYPQLIVIGVTGSYGKTSVKTILAHILSGAKRVIATPEHVNTDIGIARFILSAKGGSASGVKTDFTGADIVIVEMGAYKRGEIQIMCDMVKPTIGILTAINEQHLSLFGSMKNIQSAKYESLRSLPQDGLAVTNRDNA